MRLTNDESSTDTYVQKQYKIFTRNICETLKMKKLFAVILCAHI